jgi:anti-anti-sigma factor
MDFIKEEHNDILIEIVNITRATLKESLEFKQILREDIEVGWKKIIIDLSECEFIDSSFLGALVVSLKRITEFGGDIKLIGFQPNVNSMFHLTRMSNVFQAFPTREEALSHFS